MQQSRTRLVRATRRRRLSSAFAAPLRIELVELLHWRQRTILPDALRMKWMRAWPARAACQVNKVQSQHQQSMCNLWSHFISSVFTSSSRMPPVSFATDDVLVVLREFRVHPPRLPSDQQLVHWLPHDSCGAAQMFSCKHATGNLIGPLNY